MTVIFYHKMGFLTIKRMMSLVVMRAKKTPVESSSNRRFYNLQIFDFYRQHKHGAVDEVDDCGVIPACRNIVCMGIIISKGSRGAVVIHKSDFITTCFPFIYIFLCFTACKKPWTRTDMNKTRLISKANAKHSIISITAIVLPMPYRFALNRLRIISVLGTSQGFLSEPIRT